MVNKSPFHIVSESRDVTIIKSSNGRKGHWVMFTAFGLNQADIMCATAQPV